MRVNDMKKYYKLLNLIPLVLFIIFDCVLAIGINPVRPVFVALLLIMDIFLAKGMKDYLLSAVMLFVSSIVGIIISVTCYYYFISSDFETPIVGAFIALVYALGLAVMIGIGVIIVHIRKKLNEAK